MRCTVKVRAKPRKQPVRRPAGLVAGRRLLRRVKRRLLLKRRKPRKKEIRLLSNIQSFEDKKRDLAHARSLFFNTFAKFSIPHVPYYFTHPCRPFARRRHCSLWPGIR